MAVIAQLLARVGLDSSGFDSGAQRTKKSLRGIAEESARAQKRFQAWAAAGAALGVAYLAARRLYGVMKSIVSMAAEQEAVQRKVYAALNLVGAGTDENVAKTVAFATAIQRLTTLGDEELLQQMAIGKAMGLTTKQLGEATVAAVGLAKAYDKDLATAMRIVALGAQGETTQLKRMGIIIDQSLSPQEKYNELIRRGAEAFRLAYEETQTASGAMIQAQNRIGDVKQAIGKELLPTAAHAFKGIASLLEANQTDMAAWATNSATAIAHVISGYLKLQHAAGTYLEKIAAPRIAKKTAFDRYLQEFPEDLVAARAAMEKASKRPWFIDIRPTGTNEVWNFLTPSHPERLKELENQLRDEQNMVMRSREELRKQILAKPLTSKYEIPELNLSAEAGKGELANREALDIVGKSIYAVHLKQLDAQRAITNDYRQSNEYLRIQQEIEEATTEDLTLRKSLMDTLNRKFEGIEQAKRLKAANNEMESAFKQNINAMLWEGQSWGDSMINIVKAITAEIINMIVVEQAAKAAAGGINKVFGIALNAVGAAAGSSIGPASTSPTVSSYPQASAWHDGGIVGWPRLHGGLAADEFPAILQRGEAVTPKGGLQATVNIINQTGQNVKGKVTDTQFDGRKYITSVVLEDLNNYGPVRQAFEGMGK